MAWAEVLKKIVKANFMRYSNLFISAFKSKSTFYASISSRSRFESSNFLKDDHVMHVKNYDSTEELPQEVEISDIVEEG